MSKYDRREHSMSLARQLAQDASGMLRIKCFTQNHVTKRNCGVSRKYRQIDPPVCWLIEFGCALRKPMLGTLSFFKCSAFNVDQR
jgi:hypothetical protein